MNNSMTIDQLWQKTSLGLLDLAMQIRPVRTWALRQGEKQLHHFFLEENHDQLPVEIQRMRCQALVNLLHSVNRAFGEGRISKNVRRKLINNFIGHVVIGEIDRTVPFKQKYGFPPPTFLTISPTKKCNLCCKGCYAASSAKNDNTLPFDTLDRILQEKHEEWGSHFTVISGGEPLMYRSEGKDFLDMLRRHPDDYFMMYTNGTLIDRDMAQRLADVGNISPAISVEGWERETDARRGKGVFRKIQQAMEAMRRAGVPFGISLTATRENAEIILSDELMDYYFQEQGAIYGWIFQYMPIGRGFTLDNMVTPEQRKWLLQRELDMIVKQRRFLVDFWNGGILTVGCIGAGRSGGYFYIDWDGNIAPCAFFPYFLDNVHNLYRENRTLTEVLFSNYFKSIRKWQADYVQKGRPGAVKNLFIPCPMRDHHSFAYQTILEHHAKPLDQEAAMALESPDYRERMMEYDTEVSELLDPVWDETMEH